MISRLALIVVAAGALAGCVNPADYETTPVVLDTPQGKVTCQLYTERVVQWDRSIDRPNSMSVATADNYCVNEGIRQQKAG